MSIILLSLSLLALLLSLLLSLAPLLAVSTVSTIVSLTGLKLKSRLLLASFWLWLNLLLLYLCSQPVDASPDQVLVAGLPVPAFWMLFGVWIFPVLIWPLGFAFGFEKWREG